MDVQLIWLNNLARVILERMWGRVVVGFGDSLASLAALRHAVAVARRGALPLHVVWVCRRVVGHVTVEASVPHDPYLVSEGRRRIADAFASTLGGYPDDVQVTVDTRAYDGNPGVVLVGIARREDDLLVIGGGPARWFRPLGGSVGRYCLRHARCPVLVVPLSEFAQAVSRHPGTVRRWSRHLLQSVSHNQ